MTEDDGTYEPIAAEEGPDDHTETAKWLAESLYDAIQHSSNYSVRSQQSRDLRMGVSDIGFCHERVRRALDGQVPDDTDVLTAWIGTALGDHAEQAALRAWPNAVRQATVTVDLHGDQGTYHLTGHPDLILPEEGILVDIKTDYGLADVERGGPSDQQQYQRHCYARGAFDAGLFDPSLTIDDIKVANVWIDRAGIEKRLHADVEPYDPTWVAHAAEWLDDVVYAFAQGEEAKKDPPREMCAVVCGFFRVCRAYDTDVEGLLTDPATLRRVAMYREGLDLEKQGRTLKDQAKQHLVGVEGSTGEFFIRWTHVNETVIPEQHRRGYDKLDVRPIPKSKTVKGKS